MALEALAIPGLALWISQGYLRFLSRKQPMFLG
jgi:hypothetical protein